MQSKLANKNDAELTSQFNNLTQLLEIQDLTIQNLVEQVSSDKTRIMGMISPKFDSPEESKEDLRKIKPSTGLSDEK